MANILMVNLPYAGHTNPTLPMAAQLVERGHAVTYVNAESFRAPIEKTGARFVPYADFPAHPSEQQKKMRCFRAAFDTSLGLEEKFDLLIYEMFFYPGLQLAQRLGVPCVRQFSQPAWNAATAPDAARFFRLGCRLIDLQIMGKKDRAHMGLTRGLMESVAFDAPDLNVVYVPAVFQNKRESFGEDYLFIAPPVAAQPAGISIPYEEMPHPLIYISLGSIISNRGFCKECIRAFGNKPVSVILSTGRIDPATLGDIPRNIHAYSFVPQIEVLSHADAFLTHCGMNSANEAMAAGVPMVAMPFVNDQISNAKRLVEMGLAKRVRSFPSRGKELYNAALAVAGDAGMHARAQQVKQAVLQESAAGMEAAIARVEALIET
ncbi:MAG: glycosyltransferase [Clostridia bacterium]|nr:glycosyltransferase [Clostridia bacterium]